MNYDERWPKIPAAAVSPEDAMMMARLVADGVPVKVHLEMQAHSLPDADSADVIGEIPGREHPEQVVVMGGHLDSWDVGQGAQDDGASVIACLQAVALMKKLGLQPRRTIRFLWSAEHYGSIYQFYKHPDRLGRALALLNVDMVGYHQERAKAVFRLYTLPYSRPHFLSDVTEMFMRSIGLANSISIRNRGMESPGFYDAIFAPTGSRDQMHYAVEPFWGWAVVAPVFHPAGAGRQKRESPWPLASCPQ
jgi:hypothetical protein